MAGRQGKPAFSLSRGTSRGTSKGQHSALLAGVKDHCTVTVTVVLWVKLLDLPIRRRKAHQRQQRSVSCRSHSRTPLLWLKLEREVAQPGAGVFGPRPAAWAIEFLASTGMETALSPRGEHSVRPPVLRRQANAAHQILEPRIRPDAIEFRKHFEPNKEWGALSEGLLEPREGAVPLPQPKAYQRHVI